MTEPTCLAPIELTDAELEAVSGGNSIVGNVIQVEKSKQSLRLGGGSNSSTTVSNSYVENYSDQYEEAYVTISNSSFS